MGTKGVQTIYFEFIESVLHKLNIYETSSDFFDHSNKLSSGNWHSCWVLYRIRSKKNDISKKKDISISTKERYAEWQIKYKIYNITNSTK